MTRKMHCHNKEMKEKVMFGNISMDIRLGSSFDCLFDSSICFPETQFRKYLIISERQRCNKKTIINGDKKNKRGEKEKEKERERERESERERERGD